MADFGAVGVDWPTVKLSHRSATLILLINAALIVGMPLFLAEGGCYWLQTTVLPPRRPRFMPMNSVWIEAPYLPISWHQGWWFGCGLSPSGTTNYCRLVGADRTTVYGGEYLPCAARSPIAEADIHLVPPQDSANIWLFSEKNHGVVGFLAGGEILLPTAMIDNCAEVKSRLLQEHR